MSQQGEVRSIDLRDGNRKGGRPSGGNERLPPHNLAAEESLLGAMLLSRDAIGPAVEICSAQDFYKPAHAHIFDAIISLWSRGEPADAVTVADELSRAEVLEAVGGVSTLIAMQAATPATTNAPRYASIIEEHALLRRLISAAGDIAEMGYQVPDDIADTIDKAESLVFKIAERRVANTTASIRELLVQSLDDLEALYERGEAITGAPTGFKDLDEQLSGLQNQALLIVGARPAMGKTSFALNIASHAALQEVPVLYFSLEMGHSEITQRLLCGEARVDASRMRNGRLHDTDWPKINQAISRLGEAPIYIDDNPQCSIMDIRAKARRLKASAGGLGLVIVDYIQLMSGRTGAENRQLEVSEISRGLKILARELDVPVIGLSQLSRNLEQRTDKRPVLADLRESGSLEQDADVVMFLYRDEVYNKESPERGIAEVIVAKHRNGPVGTTKLAFIDRYTRFANMARGNE